MMTMQPLRPELDFKKLDRDLDRTKTRVFLGKSAAFYGPLMSMVSFHWDDKIPTAGTNGVYLKWNPYYFHFLSPEARMSILIHELKHVALLHPLRRSNRDPYIWNCACDTVLDNEMDLEGYIVDSRLFPVECGFAPNTKTFVDHATYGTMSAEEIYDLMIKNPPPPPPPDWGGDLIEEPDDKKQITQHQAVNNVVSAVHAAKISGNPGSVPGSVETIISKFLAPKLPWEQILYNFFNELDNKDYSWSRPSRRYQEMYLPGMVEDRNGLDHLIYYLDVSGSITDNDLLRFHSEFKYVKDTFEPLKMTMVQFDTIIQREDIILQDDPFTETTITGRGGTNFECVRDHIMKNEATAVVVFSDMHVRNPMEPLPSTMNVPIIWIALNNTGATVKTGKLIHLRE